MSGDLTNTLPESHQLGMNRSNFPCGALNSIRIIVYASDIGIFTAVICMVGVEMVNYMALAAVLAGFLMAAALIRMRAVHWWALIGFASGFLVCSFGAAVLLVTIVPFINFYVAASIGAVGWCVAYVPMAVYELRTL